MVVTVVKEENLPTGDEALLQWVTSEYTNVWSFTSIESANVISLKVGEELDAPEECVIKSNFQAHHVVANQVEQQQIGFCVFDPSQATLEVHVIWLLSARPHTSSRQSTVVVDLKESGPNTATRRNVVIVLQADTTVEWNVMSDAEIGHLTIMSSHGVNTDGLTFQDVSLPQGDIPTTGESLLRWAQEEYGAVVSFTEAVLANRFDITVGKANISRHAYLLSPDQASSTSIEGPNGPGGAPHVVVECLAQGIRALVPMAVANYYNLSPEDITLEDRQCTSAVYESLGYMLETQLDACGTTAVRHMNKMVYRNRVLFFNGSPEGSGADPDNEAEGSAERPIDDEDENEPFYMSSIECELPYGMGGDSNDINSGNNHVTLHMNMYETPVYDTRVTEFPAPLKDHTRLYFEVGVSGGDLQYEVVINQCWIQVSDVIVHSIIDFGCPIDTSVIFHEINPNHVSLEPDEESNVKRFSFEVKWTKETFNLATNVNCKLSLCARQYRSSDEERGIPMCSMLEMMPQTCSGKPGGHIPQQLATGPSKTLEVGPFLDSSGDAATPIDNTNEIDNEANVGDPACIGGCCSQTISGLGAGPAAAIAFAAFTMGVLLTACLWFIHAHTGPKREIPGSPRTLSTPSSPMGNGHIPNGHLPNGGPARAPHPPPPHIPNGLLHIHLPNGLNPNQIPARGLMNGPIGESV